ncbi:MAG: hypothetical protein ACYDAE_27640 [Steroidobacteraceae bacterium]
MSESDGYLAGQLAYQASPIILTRGIATAMGGALPIIALTEGANFIATLLSGGNPVDPDSFFANYIVLPEGTLQQNQVSTYPMANQLVAANGIISQPLTISMLMRVPAKGNFGFALKLATMTALQKSLSQHSLSGGTYSVVTPSYVYSDCLLTSFADASDMDDTQQQHTWRLDFIQPLVSKSGVAAALNGLMQKLSNGTPVSGTPSWSGYGLAVGNPTSLLSGALVPQTALQ